MQYISCIRNFPSDIELTGTKRELKRPSKILETPCLIWRKQTFKVPKSRTYQQKNEIVGTGYKCELNDHDEKIIISTIQHYAIDAFPMKMHHWHAIINMEVINRSSVEQR